VTLLLNDDKILDIKEKFRQSPSLFFTTKKEGFMNLYEILGVPRDADQKRIKRAYYTLARETHPDRQGDIHLLRFKEIVAAYEILKDPERRALYDYHIRPITSIQDLLNSTPAGSRMLSLMLPHAPAARRDGEDLLTVLEEKDGYVELPDVQHPGEVLKIPVGSSHAFCRVSDRGAPGHGGGATGRLFILPKKNIKE
jgi:curved DNA-binding protein CbpA